MATCTEPRLSGFRIDLPKVNFNINVRDINNNAIENAQIRLVGGGDTIVGVTDIQGCFTAFIQPNIKFEVTILKPLYENYTCNIILKHISELADPNKNFIIKLEDNGGNSIENAQVTITSQVHSSSGVTQSDGMFEGIVEFGYENHLLIQYSGFLDFQSEINPFTPFSCPFQDYRIIPVIILNT